MDRRTLIGALTASLLALRPTIAAQQTRKVYRIGYLSAGSQPPSQRHAVFIDALRALGWIEGSNFVLERRFAENRLERLPDLASELIGLNVDVIVTIGTLAPLSLKRLNTSIPIVLAPAGDPVGNGLVESLRRPGGNITGLSLNASELAGKRLEALKETIPS